ncbi:MAG: hypothetical protein GXP33_02215, partial [Spirochaetes bacterium]|nr:hypothetical protein [Spirochaetota bacterium]
DMYKKLEDNPENAVKLADVFLKDESIDNDKLVKPMLLNVINNRDVDMNTRIAAKLNLFLYYIYEENIKSAENLYGEIKSSLPADINKSFRFAVKYEAPFMLKCLKYLKNDLSF